MEWRDAKDEAGASRCSRTCRTAHPLTSGNNFVAVFIAPLAYRLEPPINPGRSNRNRTGKGCRIPSTCETPAPRWPGPHGVPILVPRERQVNLQVLLEEPVEDGLLGMAAGVGGGSAPLGKATGPGRSAHFLQRYPAKQAQKKGPEGPLASLPLANQ